MKKFVLILLAVLSFLEGRLGYTAIAETMHFTEQSVENKPAKMLLPSDAFLLQRKTTLTANIPQPKQQNQFDTCEKKATHPSETIEESMTTTSSSASSTTSESAIPEKKTMGDPPSCKNNLTEQIIKRGKREVKSNRWGTAPWTFDLSTGTLTVGAGDLQKVEYAPYRTGEIGIGAIKKIIFSGPVIAPKISSYLFTAVNESYGSLYNLTSLEGLNNLDVSKTVSTRLMFAYLNKVKELDLSNWDTRNVTSMGYMFYHASSLTNLDLRSFNTSRVKDFTAMFGKATSLVSLDLRSFDTKSVQYAENTIWMFLNTPNLKILKLGPAINSLINTSLGNVPTSKYTGKWVNVGDGTETFPRGTNIWTSAELMKNYNGTQADTYVWEKREANIQSIDPISFGTQTIKQSNSATTRSTITIKDTLPQTANQHWKLMVRYDSTDAQTRQWLAAQLKLSFSPHSDQPFLNLPTTLTVGEENQQIAELPDESKKGTQINQSIALNPQLQASGRVLVGTYRAQLLWDLEATPTT